MDETSSTSRAAWRLRPGRAEDAPFLATMLHEAAFWRPVQGEGTAGQPRPPMDEELTDPRVARYIEGWGRPGDAAVLAEGADGRPIGAAWYRRFSPAAPGYGFIDAATPEVSLAVCPDWRGRGVGSALLAALLAAARAEGVAALSLSVERDNPAARLYQRLGFTIVGTDGGTWTMRADLAPPLLLGAS